ncbi:MAG: NTE family protein [Psychromonas sp.]|jgi:NTE family protein|uniref:patatin-like phospholipase family protein n=1 Tax=Psychromonas sp. TaxID=1884585 RepID=UPI0039E44E6E
MVNKKTTVSLVLGSGGARGLAHIGVINWLVENNYQIKSISGSSIGALIGGIYASGNLDKYEKWVCAINRMDIISLLDIAWKSNGFVRGDKIINTLVELLGDQLIEDLPLSFTAVASDIKNEKEVWINSGSLFDAIRASISMPLFFTPVIRNGVTLIDGSVLNPMPIAPTFSDQTDMIIAVNLGGRIQKEISVQKSPKKDPPEAGDISIHNKILAFIDSFRNSHPIPSTDLGAFEIVNQALDAMQSTIARQKLASYPADYTIEIARNACGVLEFDRAQEMIDLGYQQAAFYLPSK